jgi:hypothetical protein
MKKRMPLMPRKKMSFRIRPSIYKETQIGAKCPKPNIKTSQRVSSLPPNIPMAISEIKQAIDKIMRNG